MSATRNAVPPGWVRNPSAWGQRLPLVALALVGAAIASYLTAYQIDRIDTVWEPFFGEGSRRILDSTISHLLPIPDAALGLLGYLLDAITGLIGRKDRWRSMPWMVLIFGLAIGPLGAISVILVILQPVLYDSWCTLCLASAVVSVLMIGPAMDEVLASLQFLKREQRAGRSVREAFLGRSPEAAGSAA